MLNVSLIANETPNSQKLKKELEGRYNFVDMSKSDFILVLGGDGFMLKTLHQFGYLQKPVYGINTGTVGFLMNTYQNERDLFELITNAKVNILRQLKIDVVKADLSVVSVNAINEVYLLRHTSQTAHIRISINNLVKIEELVGDGVILATPAGSTAYNFSANGTIIPLGSPLIAMTPISVFKPKRWRGALLPEDVTVTFEVISSQDRPVNAYADNVKIDDVIKVNVKQDILQKYSILFNPGHNLEERIINEQFAF